MGLGGLRAGVSLLVVVVVAASLGSAPGPARLAQPTSQTHGAEQFRSGKPIFMTGYEPGEVEAAPAEAITWMSFQNTSRVPPALPWAMTVNYDSPGTPADRWARIVTDPTNGQNHVLACWLKEATVDAGFQGHTKGRVQTGFPGPLQNATEIYMRQRVFLHEDLNLLLDYPKNADPWWIGIAIHDFWMGAAWEGHPNPSVIGLSLVPYKGAFRMELRHRAMPELSTIWVESNLTTAIPVGEWFTIEIGTKMGDGQTGHVVVMITPESTGVREVVFDVTDWTYDPQADQPGGSGPVPVTHWNPQKIYSSDNVIHFIRDQGGVAQILFDDFMFTGAWPKDWP